MKVEIIMPCINLWTKYTRPAIESILDAMMRAKTHGIDCHLVLIDNASTDDTKEQAPKIDAALMHYHRNNNRWGFQRSVNFGVKYGIDNGADLFLICNNDIVLHPEAIWRLVERLSKGDMGMVTCMDISGEMREKGIVPTLISLLDANDKLVVDEAPHPNFSAFMVSKDCWEIVGEFDELFEPAYFEDNDFHYRMGLEGVGGIVYPPAMFYHYGSRTQNEANEDGKPIVVSTMFENNRGFYVRKWGGVPGSETFKTPYNDSGKNVRTTKQLQIVVPRENL